MKNKVALAVSLALVGTLAGCNSSSSDSDGSSNLSAPFDKPVDLVIVPGMELSVENCTPRAKFEHRVSLAHSVASEMANPVYFVTGKGNNETSVSCFDTSEAEIMQDWLITNYKVSPDRIVMDAESIWTADRAAAAKQFVDEKESLGAEFSSLQLVSSHAHLYRGRNTGVDSSAMLIFNNAFGHDAFNFENSHASSAFGADEEWSDEFSTSNGWTPTNTKFVLADVTNNGLDDLVAIRDSEIFVAPSDGTQFMQGEAWLQNHLPPQAAMWSDTMTRLLGDVNGNGFVDLVSITNSGVYVNFGNGQHFGDFFAQWSDEFKTLGSEHTPHTDDAWDARKHQFQLVDMNNNGMADLVAFGDDGVYVAYSEEDKFSSIIKVHDNFGADQPYHPDSDVTFDEDRIQDDRVIRTIVDVDGDGYPDIVVHAQFDMLVSLNDGNGNFGEAKPWLINDDGEGHITGTEGRDFIHGPNDMFFSDIVDMTGNGRGDMLGMLEYGIFVGDSTGSRFEMIDVNNYSTRDRIAEVADENNQFVMRADWKKSSHFWLVGDVTGNGLNDIVGVGEDYTYVAPNLAP
ncbi:ElyC/SanA/YdcF family protein [Photobacterium sp. DNB23_23_1]|uniref:YdcF family protein n=1 Tax=Photobacterium pectinilyticum TaxID=2906793 RepID=A0ABT1MYG2_9GAMM|nr:ElyC/SanA/YdcF family protein [Photobacterium sp. ZSDE20]MCQ1057317.1 YdcF family protein [Photobacterium sp. ZSDE20]MDD1821776.1 YdcF family protein [Photobacterium sp. ZSDE20]